MVLLISALLAFAIADLFGRSLKEAGLWRQVVALAVTTGCVTGFLTLAGISGSKLVALAVISAAVTAVWVLLEDLDPDPRVSLAWPLAVLASGFAAGASDDPVSGRLADWYSGLPLSFTDTVSIDQFLVAVAGALFLLSTANRIVRLVLDVAAKTGGEGQDGLLAKGESTLRGGRLIGSMERLIVATLIVAGDPAGAAIVIAAKGVVRLPEIRSQGAKGQGAQDEVAEYFLIGTFSSLLLAGGASLAVLAVS